MSRQDLHTNTLTRVLLNLKDTSGKGITFIKGNAEEEVLYYDQLIREAMQVLGSLQQRGIQSGDELILQVEDNRTFIILFWACIFGKIIPVPLSTGNQDDHKLKLLKVYQTLNRPWLVCDQQQLDRLEKYATENDHTDLFKTIRQNTFAPGELESAEQPGIIQKTDTADIAYIQFSSGSTGEPKGVILTHANLVANITDIASRSGVDADDRMLSWMPLTHDMGLICFHLTGVIAAAAQYLMPTTLFVRRPVLWIEKANEHKISLLYSPNFGYSYFLAAFNSASGEAAGWDLSSIRIIYNGAEPISHELCERFIHTLGQYGLRATAMYPGYGMAEASVAVCLPNPGDPMRSYNVNRKSLKTGKKIKLVDKDESGVSFMEVGYPIPQCRVRIADDNDNELKDECLGNIQIAGANVTAGYYNNEAATEKVITTDGWLRTGDLGFFINGRLVITGRAKNIIILYGQNYYPQDIERAVEQVQGIGPGKVVACGVKNPSSWKEELVLFILFKEKLPQFVALIRSYR
jgi:acyl-CoA synthetase (AMP-forming)/AMP-acid ligase II